MEEKSVESPVCLFLIFFKPPQKIFCSPRIVVYGVLTQIGLPAADIWPFLGRIWSVLDPCDMKQKNV